MGDWSLGRCTTLCGGSPGIQFAVSVFATFVSLLCKIELGGRGLRRAHNRRPASSHRFGLFLFQCPGHLVEIAVALFERCPMISRARDNQQISGRHGNTSRTTSAS